MNLTHSDSNLQTPILDVPSAIVQRRSVKAFKPDAIAPALLKQLVDLTIAAPSSYNIQSWRIVLVQSDAQKAILTETCWNQQQGRSSARYLRVCSRCDDRRPRSYAHL